MPNSTSDNKKKNFRDKIKEGTIVTQRLFHEIQIPNMSSLSIIKYHISTPPFYFDCDQKIKHNLLCYSNKMALLQLHSFVSQLTIRKLLTIYTHTNTHSRSHIFTNPPCMQNFKILGDQQPFHL